MEEVGGRMEVEDVEEEVPAGEDFDASEEWDKPPYDPIVEQFFE